MERVELTDGHVVIRQTKDTEDVGYELTFEVRKGSALDADLKRCFTSGDFLPMPYSGEDLSISLRTMVNQDAERVYEGTAGFLRSMGH